MTRAYRGQYTRREKKEKTCDMRGSFHGGLVGNGLIEIMVSKSEQSNEALLGIHVACTETVSPRSLALPG